MSDARVATGYLRPATADPWRWTDGGSVLAWTSGETIAFRAEVADLVGHLAGGGLPPFRALVLLLSLCRDETPSGGLALLVGRGIARPHPTTDPIFAFQRLPARLRSGPARVVLAELLFDELRGHVPPRDAEAIATALRHGFPADALEPDESAAARDPRVEPGAIVAFGRLDVAALELRLRTGLEQIPRPAPIDPAAREGLSGVLGLLRAVLERRRHEESDRPAPPAVPEPQTSAAVRALVERLREDPEHAGLSRLARDLMAAVHIPRAVTTPEDLPVGGVSDLANRGPLDRLLASELAHDDLTLAVRIVEGEALYIRREAPPRAPPGTRAILLDAGIRLWGVPRVFATAVGLAFAAGSERRALAVWRARGAALVPVDLGSREGLVAHLAALEPDPHPAPALRPFLDAARAESVRTGGPCEAIVVTHEDVLADAEFARALAGVAGDDGVYVATVARSGRFRCIASSRRGMRSLEEAELDLEALLAPPAGAPRAPTTPLLPPSDDESLPDALLADRLPLLLPAPLLDPRLYASDPLAGVVAISKRRRLVHFPFAERGARELRRERLPGPALAIALDAGASRAYAVVSCAGPAETRLVTASLDGRDGDVVVLEKEPDTQRRAHGAFFDGGSVVLIGLRRLSLYDVRSGLIEAPRFELEERVRARQGPYVQVRGSWHRISVAGRSLRLLEVPGGGRGALAAFDRAGREGPWLLFPDRVAPADPFATPGRQVGLRDVGPDRWVCDLVRVSRDGDRLLVRERGRPGGARSSIVSLTDGTSRTIANDPTSAATALDPEIGLPAPVHLRRKIGAIAVEAGRIWLYSSRGAPVRIELAGAQGPLALVVGSGAPSSPLRFEPAGRQRDPRLRLGRATFPDGSLAFMDGRGLLHLRSADASVQEVTLALAHPAIAACTSGGLRCGGEAFHDPGTPFRNPAEAAEVFACLHRFAARLR